MSADTSLPPLASARFLKVHVDLIRRLGINRAVVLAAIINRSLVSKYGMSIEALAADLGLSWRQTQRYILGLEKAGHITIERESGKVSSMKPLSQVSGVITKSVRGAQIQTPVTSVRVKEDKERSKERRAASPAVAASPPDDGERPLAAKGDTPFAIPRPGIVEVGARRPLEEIGDLLRVARRPSATEDVIPIAAQVERETKKRRDDEWARANGFVKIGGKGPLRQREIDRRLEGL